MNTEEYSADNTIKVKEEVKEEVKEVVREEQFETEDYLLVTVQPGT